MLRRRTPSPPPHLGSVGKADFDATIALRPRKVQSLSVETRELVRFNAPSVAHVLTRDAGRAAAYAADITFVSPDNSGSESKPASITRNATVMPCSGSASTNVDADLRDALSVLNNGSHQPGHCCMADAAAHRHRTPTLRGRWCASLRGHDRERRCAGFSSVPRRSR
jgi:hypothetical protein